MPPSPGHLAAQYARDCATNRNSTGYLNLSAQMCWDAVVLCAHASGAIDRKTYQRLQNITATNFSSFVRMIDPIVGDAAAMRRIPQGSFLGFIEHKNNIPTLIHAMIAVGHGLAAGNKNACIGIGNPVGWEILDLAGRLNWVPGTNCFNTAPPGQPGQRLVQIRYRTL
ncbi:MAG: hypothetical protein KatS3mg043_0567 [Rhodothermaceae bacterium]|nr:MAG: hypothetical protein KatS3mg043_0567 [Rhodothermaceae bacterium]